MKVCGCVTGEVQHWVWLLRAFMDKCAIENVSHMLTYLVTPLPPCSD